MKKASAGLTCKGTIVSSPFRGASYHAVLIAKDFAKILPLEKVATVHSNGKSDEFDLRTLPFNKKGFPISADEVYTLSIWAKLPKDGKIVEVHLTTQVKFTQDELASMPDSWLKGTSPAEGKPKGNSTADGSAQNGSRVKPHKPENGTNGAHQSNGNGHIASAVENSSNGNGHHGHTGTLQKLMEKLGEIGLSEMRNPIAPSFIRLCAKKIRHTRILIQFMQREYAQKIRTQKTLSKLQAICVAGNHESRWNGNGLEPQDHPFAWIAEESKVPEAIQGQTIKIREPEKFTANIETIEKKGIQIMKPMKVGWLKLAAWQADWESAPGIVKYDFQVSQNGGLVIMNPNLTNQFTQLPPDKFVTGVNYTASVIAKNDAGESEAQETIFHIEDGKTVMGPVPIPAPSPVPAELPPPPVEKPVAEEKASASAPKLVRVTTLEVIPGVNKFKLGGDTNKFKVMFKRSEGENLRLAITEEIPCDDLESIGSGIVVLNVGAGGMGLIGDFLKPGIQYWLMVTPNVPDNTSIGVKEIPFHISGDIIVGGLLPAAPAPKPEQESPQKLAETRKIKTLPAAAPASQPSAVKADPEVAAMMRQLAASIAQNNAATLALQAATQALKAAPAKVQPEAQATAKPADEPVKANNPPGTTPPGTPTGTPGGSSNRNAWIGWLVSIIVAVILAGIVYAIWKHYNEKPGTAAERIAAGATARENQLKAQLENMRRQQALDSANIPPPAPVSYGDKYLERHDANGNWRKMPVGSGTPQIIIGDGNVFNNSSVNGVVNGDVKNCQVVATVAPAATTRTISVPADPAQESDTDVGPPEVVNPGCCLNVMPQQDWSVSIPRPCSEYDVIVDGRVCGLQNWQEHMVSSRGFTIRMHHNARMAARFRCGSIRTH